MENQNNYGRTSQNNAVAEELEKIDLIGILKVFWFGFKRLWLLMAVLTIVLAVVSYFRTTSTYTPSYVASATVSVSGGNSTATELVNIYPYLSASGAVTEAMTENLGTDTVYGSVSLSADSMLNLITVSVTGDDPEAIYQTLQAFLETYPSVTEFVLGHTSFTVLDETGIPSDTRRQQVIRGSFRRGAVRGFGISMIILILYVLANYTVHSKNEIRRYINLDECGSLPHVQVKKRRNSKGHSAISLQNERIPQSYLEATRKLRIKVLQEAENHHYKSILVTSSIPGEGKTTIAANVALSMAQHGKKVILVDCDVRNPSVLSTVLPDKEAKDYPGLLSVLNGTVTVDDALVSVPLPENTSYGEGSLTAICGGEADHDASGILGSEEMQTLLEQLEGMYDIVVLDTAPAELLTDATLLAQYADAALYVVRYEYVKGRQLRGGVQSLSNSGIPMIGYVLNDDRSAKSHGYGYAYGYGYGGGYGKYGKYSHYSTEKK